MTPGRFRGALLVLVFLAAGESILGCNTIAGIEKADYDATLDRIPTNNLDRLPGWGLGLRFADDTCSKQVDVDEALVRGCMLRTSCDPLVPYFNISDCVSYGYQTLSGLESCGKRAETCEDIEDCLHRKYVDEDEEALCDGGELWVCDDDDAIHCIDVPYKYECGEIGATCSPHQNASYEFVLGCAPTTEPDCAAAAAGEYYCDGDFLYTCIDGNPQGYNCASTGTTCFEGSPGKAFCNPRLTTCDERATLSCVGDAIQLCDVDGRFDTYDCGAAGLSCVPNGSQEANCEAAGCDALIDCEEGCFDESTVRLCVGGASVLLDCTEYGFTDCYEGELSDDTPYAGCF